MARTAQAYRNVLAQPTAVAVADGEGETTYGELGLRVNRIAQKLQECGVRLETPVAVFAERSTALVTGFAGSVGLDEGLLNNFQLAFEL